MSAPKAPQRMHDRQVIHPPWGGADRASQIKSLVKPELLPEINRRLFAGTLAIGEVGLAAPTAVTVRLDDGSFVVEMYSGLMHLIYLMARTLHSFSTDHGPGGVIAPALSHEQLVRKGAQIFLDWKAGQLASESGFRQREQQYPDPSGADRDRAPAGGERRDLRPGARARSRDHGRRRP